MILKPIQNRANSLLSHLSPDASAAMYADSQSIQLSEGDVISNPEARIEHVMFPLTGVLSTLSVLSDKSGVETSVTGNEGVAPLALFHGVESSPEQTIVQVAGEALRVPSSVFLRAVQADRAFDGAIHRFAAVMFTQSGQNSGCNRRHSVVQRCARWLLQTHDRVLGDEFALTHLFLSQMMGVRRSSVTVAAEQLRAAGAISYTRGVIKIVDREALQNQACECYAISRAFSDRVLRSGQTPSPLAGVKMSDKGKSLVGAPARETVEVA